MPAPRVAQPPVDLDLPFTLDQPSPTPTATTPEATVPRPASTAGPNDAAHSSGATPEAGTPGGTDPRPATTAGPDDTAHTTGTTPEATTPEATKPGATTPEATTPGATAPRPVTGAADGTGADAPAADGEPPGGEAESPGDRGAGTPPNGRPDSPWAEPPQRATADPTTPAPHSGPAPPATQPITNSAASGPVAPAAGATPPAQDGPHEGPEGAAPAADGSPEAETPRLGPFPPSPGVPLPQSYGDGTAYPPGPVGYGQPTPGPGGYGQPAPGPGGYGQPTPGPGGYGQPTPGPGSHGQPTPGPVGYGPPAAHAGPPAPAPQAGAPGWYPPAWPQQPAPPPQPGAPQAQPAPAQQPGMQQPGPAAYPEQVWTPASGAPPTAEDFARRRQVRPVDPVATMGVRAVVNKIGLVRLAPGRQEQEMRRDIEMVRRNFGGLRQVTVVNPKGGAGKTVAILLLAMTFGQKRGGYVLAWDNNETQGTLGMRAQQDFHSRTVRDMLRDLAQFQGSHGRVGDLSQYVRSQGEGMFDVLASDESATGGEMLTAAAFAEIREVVSRFYKLIFVDTGNNVRAQNWQAAMDATDQLVVTMSARNDSAETAARMLDHLEQSGRQRLVRQAVTVVSMPPSRKEIDLPAIQEHFAARTRAVLLAPYERLIDTGEPIRYGQLSSATRDAWLKIAASVAEGL
ncbi:chromosome partitioning protein [Micromonospora sp. A3M-1-15]|uniref:MinD/ParA family ATP-binding protein n=1 Tax=Micromonospora sp. A3M-1-15 TaxID=2962035 RepID=UPI0020B711BC|nr:chromosome partitioning protein [Micromonospora sp. A3M-1-15]MCP3787428.1 chromosome partitioning protein [Micromonospora sp. A3M-1-15]